LTTCSIDFAKVEGADETPPRGTTALFVVVGLGVTAFVGAGLGVLVGAGLAVGTGVLVGGTDVTVGLGVCVGVAVGGKGVEVGGKGVADGGSGVEVGGSAGINGEVGVTHAVTSAATATQATKNRQRCAWFDMALLNRVDQARDTLARRAAHVVSQSC
jgi:hypothetical protein